MHVCEWCEIGEVEMKEITVYWELPDGTRAIEITNTPTNVCVACGMKYQSEEMIKEIEDQLLLIDTKKIGKTITYSELMAIPRWLKENYFDNK